MRIFGDIHANMEWKLLNNKDYNTIENTRKIGPIGHTEKCNNSLQSSGDFS